MSEGEKFKFLASHQREIQPLTSEDAVIDSKDNPERIQQLLETYETKVLTYTRPGTDGREGKILLEASQPANRAVIEPLVEKLKNNPECEGITLLADGLAGKAFVEESLLSFEVAPTGDTPIFSDIPSGPYRSALVIDDAQNSPAESFSYSAKSVFGAEKLYYLSLGLFGPQEQKILGNKANATRDQFDAVLTADEFVKDMLVSVLQIPPERVVVTGSPLLESVKRDDADTVRTAARQRLAINDDVRTVLYSGFPSADLASMGADVALNKLTFEKTLAGLREAAKNAPETKFAFIVRTHPRARSVEAPLSFEGEVLSNLQIIDGNDITYDEAIYASDIIGCNILSTESLLARYRGREAMVFAYDGKGETGNIVDAIYGNEGFTTLQESDRMNLVQTPNDVAQMLTSFAARPALPVPVNCTERIAEILLHGLKPSQ